MSTRRTLETASGPVVASVDGDLIRARGIPYATARRFRRPTEVTPWSQPREAFTRGPCAPQDPPAGDSVAGVVGGDLVASEDCLVVTVTATPDAHRQPVMVWFHGGAYVSGAGEAPEYDADDLAREGIVVVTVTYRLGVLGYLAPPGFDDNLGLHDQIAALRWVHASIAAFGGDPDRVTIAGHSAGGDAVVSLMLSHVADGLYRRAIVQSAPLGLRLGRSAMTSALRSALVELLPDPEAASLDDVLAAQRELVLRAVDFGNVRGLPFATVMGSAPLSPADAAEARLADVARRVDLLVGYAAQDASPFVLQDQRVVALMRLRPIGRILVRPVIRRITQSVFGRPARDLAARWRGWGGGTAEYVFGWAPQTGDYGSCHSIELPFLFSGDWSDAPMLGGEKPDPEVASRMRSAWAGFVRDGVDGLESRSLVF